MAQVPVEVSVRNSFQVLSTVDGDDLRPSPTHSHLQELTSKATAERVLRTVKQLKLYYENHFTQPRPSVPLADLDLMDDAETFKTALMQYTPSSGCFNTPVLSKASALWNRISMQRLRFQGRRRHYLVARTLDNQHRLLVLQVPPANSTTADLLLHARRQMTYNDDLAGRYQPGLRLKDSFTDHLIEGEEFIKEGYLGGFPLQLIETPTTVHLPNYESYDKEHRELSENDADRQHASGYVEELLYNPTVIHPQGGILKDNGKYRPVLDCAASGLNELLVPLPCNYDLLDSTLQGLRPGDHLSGFDWADAFYLWPRLQQHCDYLGLVAPSGRVFRYRFTAMGLMDSPSIQSWGARVLKRIINKNLARVCDKQAVPGAKNSEVLGVFVDDGKIRHDKACTHAQMHEQYQAYVDTIEHLRLPGSNPVDSVKKQEWPSPTGTHIGLHIDPQTMHVSITDERRAKYVKDISNSVKDWAGQDSVPRHQWASLLGKLQFTAPLVKGMQSRLASSYGVLKDTVSGRYNDWRRRARSHCRPHHLRDLLHASELLLDREGCKRRIYYDASSDTTAFWKGVVPDTHDDMDRTSATASGIHVFTGDADKGAAGLWFHDQRHVRPFPIEHQPPHRSSNFRELSTAHIGLEFWEDEFRGSRVLYRSDNLPTVAIINKGGTTAPDLVPVSDAIQALARSLNVDLAAAHIPGVLNGLADRLSRHRRGRDTSDWQLVPAIFHTVHDYIRHHWLPLTPTGGLGSLTLDGSADVTGSNAQLPRFCSEVDSVLRRDLRGEHLWVNPDFTKISEILGHFLLAYRTAPQSTSGTFLLPAWFDHAWWKLTKGARVVAFYPKGTNAFTSPDWRALTSPTGALTYGAQRVFRGPTRWDFVIIHFPCVLGGGSRSVRRASDGPRRRDAVESAGRHRLPVLRGDPGTDGLLLRGLRAGLVC